MATRPAPLPTPRAARPRGAATGLIGSSLYDEHDADTLPDAALAAALGLAGIRRCSPTCTPARSCSTSGRVAGSMCCCRPAPVGPTGLAYGLDMTPEMLELARQNQAEVGVINAEFLLGTIEDVPLPLRVGRRDHLQLRGEPLPRRRGAARGVPGAETRRAPCDLRHRPTPAAARRSAGDRRGAPDWVRRGRAARA